MTHFKRGLGFACTLVLVTSIITVIMQILMGNQNDLETTVAFGVAVASVVVLAALREPAETPADREPHPGSWDPHTIESAKRRSQGIE